MKQEIDALGEPSGGWGSLKSVTSVLVREHVALAGTRVLAHQNKPEGFSCVSCAWAKPAHPHPAEFCENGAKATAWEITTKRTPPEFFQHYTLAQLRREWSDHQLEEHGRLTAPLRFDAASDRYVETSWEEAFQGIARELRALNPNETVFYTSGEVAYLLPCLGRLEIDRQGDAEQTVATEDSTGCMHGSRGIVEPASPLLLSEPAIIAGIAKALLPANPRVAWDRWVSDYSLIRESIAQTFPEIFHDFNARMFTPGGFHRPLAARHRHWKTSTGKANFIKPTSLDADPDMQPEAGQILRLMTIRSNDQFNTTIYGFEDRLHGIHGTRQVLLMSAEDIQQHGLRAGDLVTVSTVASDLVREVHNLRITPYAIPRGCAAAYYPECNALIPLWHHAAESKVPASKSIPIRIQRTARA